MKLKNTLGLIIAVIIPQLVGYVGSVAMVDTLPRWYESLNQSSLTPPNYTFGIVWPILFLLMGIASFIVWRKGLGWPEVRLALFMYTGQLFLNGLWSWLFFGAQNPLAALFNILALWLAIAATTIAFSRISRTAAFLMLPYLLWVTFATYLNYQIVLLN